MLISQGVTVRQGVYSAARGYKISENRYNNLIMESKDEILGNTFDSQVAFVSAPALKSFAELRSEDRQTWPRGHFDGSNLLSQRVKACRQLWVFACCLPCIVG